MNFLPILLSALGAIIVYMAIGGIAFTIPGMKSEYMKYPAVYRPQEGIKRVMPFGMVAMFIAMVMLALLFSMIYKRGSGFVEGAAFGAIIGIFSVGSFVIHNYVNLNIGEKLTFQQSIAYFVEWVAVGIVIGIIYGAF